MTSKETRNTAWRRSVWRHGAAAALLAASVSAPAPVMAGPTAPTPSLKPAKQLFGGKTTPSAQDPVAIGGYARGCLAGGSTLAADGPGWQAMRLSRNRRHGHPALIAFVKRLAGEATGLGWPGILIGDLAQARGGPMLTGHASHQIGLDADIWLRPAPATPFTRKEREEVSAINYVAKDRRTVISGFSPQHHALLRKAAEDDAVARIFVNAAIKKALCVEAERKGEDTGWLRKIRPWWGHDHHFHVRLNCPPGSGECRDQSPPPPGSGCEEVDSWLTDEALNPKPRKKSTKKRRELTLADLPDACGAVLKAGNAAN